MPGSRRSFLIGFGGVAAGGGAVALFGRRTVVTAATIDGFSMADTSATLDGTPQSVEIVVDGEFEWALDEAVDSVRADLSIEYDGVEEELGNHVVFSPDMEGVESFSITADLLDHPELGDDDFDVDEAQTETLHFDAAIEVSAVDGGSTREISRETDSFVIEVTGEGIFLRVSAQGSVTVNE